MDANEIFRQLTRTNTFRRVVGQKNIPAAAYENVNVLENQTSEYPFIQALKQIAIDYDINNAERTYNMLLNTLLKTKQ